METQSSSAILAQYLRTRIGRVCVALSAPSPSALLEKAIEAVRENSFVEFRLDSLEKPHLFLPKLKSFLADRPLVTAIATCRRKANGGGFTGTVAEEIEIIRGAIAAGAQIADVSIETAEAVKAPGLQPLREANAAILLSWHDFKETGDLEAVYRRMAKFTPEFYKIVPTAKSLADSLRLFDLLTAHADDTNLVALAMGSHGVVTRLLGPRFGSLFTFAAATAGEETAPGQVAARTLNELYRLDSIEAGTRIYGVAGSPIGSSLSPLMLNTALRRETVNAVYLALETDKVKDLLHAIEKIPLHGLSITMPLKQEVLPHLEKTDPFSARIGACNTIIRAQDGKLYGFNTDVGGIVGPLERRLLLRNAKVLVLGAGGAARAAVFGLKDKGAEVFILNRTPEKAQKLARQSGAKVQRRDQLAKTRFDVIINATPYGMANQKIAAPISPDEFNCGLFFDLVYNPIETPLIRLARSKNIPVILGVEMFVQQGARQFEIWTGKPAPQDEMLRVVVHALRQSSEATSQPSTPSAPKATEVPVAPKPVVAQPAPVKKAVAAPAVVAKKTATPAVVKKPVVSSTKPAAKKSVPAKKAAAPAKKTAPAKKAPAKKVSLPKKAVAKKKTIPPKRAPAKKG